MKVSLVSIIVPMYNSEKTILKCMDTLINQSWSNIEIVVVDDGSKDNSFCLVEGIKDKRIKLISKSNGGASSARNLGIKNATGDYLLFVDADDYIDINMVKELVKYADENAIVFSNTYVKERQNEYILKLFRAVSETIDKHRAMKEIISGGGGLICSKLISKNVIDENAIEFNEALVLGEDQVFFLEAVSHSKKFIYLDKAFYHYDRTDKGSATNKYHENLVDNYIILQKLIEESFESAGFNSTEDKKILNNKIKRWFWECIDNEVKIMKDKGFKNTLKRIRNITAKVSNVVDKHHLEVKCITDKLMDSALKRKSYLSAFNVVLISKILMIKNG